VWWQVIHGLPSVGINPVLAVDIQWLVRVHRHHHVPNERLGRRRKRKEKRKKGILIRKKSSQRALFQYKMIKISLENHLRISFLGSIFQCESMRIAFFGKREVHRSCLG